MFTVKKIFAFKDYMIFVILALYFAVCYFAVSNFEIYSVTEKTDMGFSLPESFSVMKNTPETENDESAPLITDTRTLKEYRGVIGIFDCFGCLLGSFDIEVALLPYADRKSLDDGIVFANENEMRDFLATLDS